VRACHQSHGINSDRNIKHTRETNERALKFVFVCYTTTTLVSKVGKGSECTHSTRHGVPSVSERSEHCPTPSVVVVSVTVVAGAPPEAVVLGNTVVGERVVDPCAVVVAGLRQ
jgi:hypothetical protein